MRIASRHRTGEILAATERWQPVTYGQDLYTACMHDDIPGMRQEHGSIEISCEAVQGTMTSIHSTTTSYPLHAQTILLGLHTACRQRRQQKKGKRKKVSLPNEAWHSWIESLSNLEVQPSTILMYRFSVSSSSFKAADLNALRTSTYA